MRGHIHALDKKLVRDLLRLWPQALAIALVLACGVAIFLMGFGMYRTLEASRDDYYDQNRFPDVFATVHRAPRALRGEIAAIDGVWAVDLRVTGTVMLKLPGSDRAASGQIISLPPGGARLSVPLVVEGRLPDPDSSAEVAVTAPFARANGFHSGDGFTAIINGRERDLTIVGTVLSPEFIYSLPPGGLLPDNARFGVLYMPEAAVASAFDLDGAFNDVALKLSRSADAETVIDRLDTLLAPYGGLGGHGRDQQISHSFIDSEIKQLKIMSYILPPIFFGIAAFLVNMVLARIIALERSEIGLMKAVGYSNLEVAVHYMMLAGLIAAVGIVFGWLVGGWLTHGLTILYARFYDFPYLVRTSVLDAYAISGLAGLATALTGAARAALWAARLAPAVAMQPPAPPHFRRGLADGLLARLKVTQPTMMILRGIGRWPLRSALTSLGLALAVSVVIASNFFQDAIDRIVDVAFFAASRQHATLVLNHAAPLAVVEEARALPGVLAAEPEFVQPAVLRHGPREKRLAISARPADADLARITDDKGLPLAVPDDGVMLSEQVASQLGVRPGDIVEAEFLDGRRETHAIRVAGTVTQYFGIGAYMDPGALAALNRTEPRVSAVNLMLDESRLDAFHAAVKDLPGLAATVMLTDVRTSFQDTIRENMNITTIVYVTIAVLITIGVAYNGARIQLSERARELASLRILGFTRAEVSYILAGETLLLTLLAQPLGWLLGYGIAWSMVAGFDSDLYRIPLVITSANLARSSLIVLAASTAAVLLVRRRLDHFDLVSVMKTRE